MSLVVSSYNVLGLESYPYRPKRIRSRKINTKLFFTSEFKRGEDFNFVKLYKDFGVFVDTIYKIESCKKSAYVISCSGCDEKFFLPVRCQNRYYCKDCREFAQKKQVSEIMNIFTYLFDGVKRIRSLRYGKGLKLIKQIFTLPKEITYSIIGDRELINKFAKVIRKTLTRFWSEIIRERYRGRYGDNVDNWQIDIGGVMGYHEWSSKHIWKKHFHYEIIYPNLVRIKDEKGWLKWDYIPYWLRDELRDRLREIYTEEINANFETREEIPTCNYDHKYIDGWSYLLHRAKYMCRVVTDDFEEGFRGYKEEYIRDRRGLPIENIGLVLWENQSKEDSNHTYVVPVPVMREIIFYKAPPYCKRIRWFGFLGDGVKSKNLKRLGVCRVKKPLENLCPACESPLYLDTDETVDTWEKDHEYKWSKERWSYWVMDIEDILIRGCELCSH